jgi:hypothetical protein
MVIHLPHTAGGPEVLDDLNVNTKTGTQLKSCVTSTVEVAEGLLG